MTTDLQPDLLSGWGDDLTEAETAAVDATRSAEPVSQRCLVGRRVSDTEVRWCYLQPVHDGKHRARYRGTDVEW